MSIVPRVPEPLPMLRPLLRASLRVPLLALFGIAHPATARDDLGYGVRPADQLPISFHTSAVQQEAFGLVASAVILFHVT